MSTKLLVDAPAGLAEPIAWKAADPGSGVINHPVPAFPAAGPAQSVAAVPAEPPLQDHRTVQTILEQQHRIHELERLVDQRAREAYDQGHAAGLEQGRASVESAIARFAKAVEDLAGLRRRVRAEAEEDAVRLSLAVARKILHREVTIDPESLLGLVKAALQRVDARELNRLRLNPEDIPPLERHLAKLGLPPRLEVVADPSLERGGVILETDRGQLDASIDTQLAEIERGFVDIVRRSQHAV